MTNIFDNPPEGEPTILVAKDTWIWRRSDLISDYPAALYNLSYSFKRSGDTNGAVTQACANVNASWQTTVPLSATQNMAAGEWQWALFATRISDSARQQIGFGRFTVKVDRVSDTTDPRSHAQRTLAAIEAVIENRATADTMSYSIAGRSLSKMSPEQLRDWREYYRRAVAREIKADRLRDGKPTGMTQAVRFLS